jgi:hypothetical protein
MGFQPVMAVFGRRNLCLFVHKVVFGATGVIASQDLPSDSGVVLGARISAGRYKATFPSKYRVFHGGWATVLGPDTAVYGAKTTGNNFVLRANKVDANTPDGTVLVQWLNPSTDATNYIDADVPDNLTAFLFFVISQ